MVTRNPHQGKPARDPRASGRPTLTQGAIAAVAAEYGSPVVNPNSADYLRALDARDRHWDSMPESLPNDEQTAWLLDGWRKFYETLGYTRKP